MELRIGVISAYSYAEKSFGHFALTNIKLIFRIGFLDKALELAMELQEVQKVDAIMTLGVPMEIFDETITTPIYPIYPSNYDILNALYEARNFGEKLAFAEVPFKSVLYDFEHIVKILGFDIKHYRFSTRESIEQVVNQVIDDRRDVLVTMGGYSYSFARSLNLPAVLVVPETQSFYLTMENIRTLFLERSVETEKNRWLRAVLDNAKEGVLVLDHEKKVVVLNSSAQMFMHLDQNEIVGRHIDEVHSSNPLFLQFLNTPNNFEVFKSKTNEYVVKKEVLYAGDFPLGTVIRANPIKELQQLELVTRKKINESGFVAVGTFHDIKGSSNVFEKIKQKAIGYAKSRSNIILYGESGSGKEIFAQSIHNASPCADGPFVAINCTVLTETLLESELFGYEEGAFTGAIKGGKPGLFEIAHKGTLFLDEIGDMPLSIQVKLLRVLQERIVRRISGSKNIPIDVRFIFATNRNLQTEILDGSFRKDLYYRINVLSLYIPPLCEHKEDLKEIAEDALKRLSTQTGKSLILSDESIKILQKYDWPGNVRELNNFLERALIHGDDSVISDMFNELTSVGLKKVESNTSLDEGKLSVGLDTMHNMEESIIKTLYERYDGNRKKIGDVLNISVSTLYRRLKEMDISDSN